LGATDTANAAGEEGSVRQKAARPSGESTVARSK